MKTTFFIFALSFIFIFAQLPKDKIPHTYKEIAEKVNNLKTTWKAIPYERDFRPLLGTIMDGEIPMIKKTFENKIINKYLIIYLFIIFI